MNKWKVGGLSVLGKIAFIYVSDMLRHVDWSNSQRIIISQEARAAIETRKSKGRGTGGHSRDSVPVPI